MRRMGSGGGQGAVCLHARREREPRAAGQGACRQAFAVEPRIKSNLCAAYAHRACQSGLPAHQ